MLARPGLPSFDYVKANSADEVVRLLEAHQGGACLLMGGTDLFPKMRDGAMRPDVLVDVKHLPGMRDVTYDEETGLTVGAAVTMNELVRHPHVQARYPLLAQAANAVGSYQVRNRATIGGNLCNASPCADAALATLVLEGNLVLHGELGDREVPVGAFFVGPGETVLETTEFLTAVRFPIPPAGAVGRHLKLSRNRLGDLSLVSVDVLGFPMAGGSTELSGASPGYGFRVGLGSVAPTVVRASEAEQVLVENSPGENTFALAAEKAMEAAAPIDDIRASADYRRAMVRNLTLRGSREVWEQLREE
jgi:carbon-monoxide dehydrogenase medium subunit